MDNVMTGTIIVTTGAVATLIAANLPHTMGTECRQDAYGFRGTAVIEAGYQVTTVL